MKEANSNIGDGPTLYNPDVMEQGEPEKTIRIFLNKLEEGEEALKPVHETYVPTKTMDPVHRWSMP